MSQLDTTLRERIVAIVKDQGALLTYDSMFPELREVVDQLEALYQEIAREAVQQKLRYLAHFDRTLAANGSCELFEALDRQLTQQPDKETK